MFNQEKKHHDQKLRLEEARDILYHNQQLGWEVMEWLDGYLLSKVLHNSKLHILILFPSSLVLNGWKMKYGAIQDDLVQVQEG